MLYQRITRSRVTVFLMLLSAASQARVAPAHGQAFRAAAPSATVDQGELLLVRAWDSKSGELVGWMPMHRLAITLQRIDAHPISFDLNEPVTIRLPFRPGATVERDEIRVAPEAKVFEGRKWLPAIREVNLVRVGKSIFYIKSIIFGESKWRYSSKPKEAD